MCDVLDVHVASFPVTWPSREKKRVKCEGPPSLGAVYQNVGVWRRRVIARFTWSNGETTPWRVTPCVTCVTPAGRPAGRVDASVSADINCGGTGRLIYLLLCVFGVCVCVHVCKTTTRNGIFWVPTRHGRHRSCFICSAQIFCSAGISQVTPRPLRECREGKKKIKTNVMMETCTVRDCWCVRDRAAHFSFPVRYKYSIIKLQNNKLYNINVNLINEIIASIYFIIIYRAIGVYTRPVLNINL